MIEQLNMEKINELKQMKSLKAEKAVLEETLSNRIEESDKIRNQLIEKEKIHRDVITELQVTNDKLNQCKNNLFREFESLKAAKTALEIEQKKRIWENVRLISQITEKGKWQK